jgi:hypothetical protein
LVSEWLNWMGPESWFLHGRTGWCLNIGLRMSGLGRAPKVGFLMAGLGTGDVWHKRIRALSAHSAAKFNILPDRRQHVWLVAIVPTEGLGKMDRNDCYIHSTGELFDIILFTTSL